MKKIPLDETTDLLVTDACFDQLESAKAQGLRIVYNACDLEDMPTVCSNCKGLEIISFELLSPYRGERRRSRKFLNSPCPACCPDHEKERITFLLGESGLQPVEYHWTLDYAAQYQGKREAILAMSSLLASAPWPSGWITLYGSYGTGKSGLLKATVAGFCHAGVSANYSRAGDILSEAKATFSGDQEALDSSERAIKARYGRYQFLALDEIDRIPMTDWSMSFLFSILDDRYNRRQHQATAIATNKMPGQMGAPFHYLEDRMRDGQRLVMAGRSLRGPDPGRLGDLNR